MTKKRVSFKEYDTIRYYHLSDDEIQMKRNHKQKRTKGFYYKFIQFLNQCFFIF